MKHQSIEHKDQVKLFKWASKAMKILPKLKLLYANANSAVGWVKNGGGTGKPNFAGYNYFLSEGFKAGVPDVTLPVHSFPHHGLYMELKTRTGSLSRKQKHWKELLEEEEFLVITPRSFEEARDTILDYLSCHYGYGTLLETKDIEI
jgi:hypothetical protein